MKTGYVLATSLVLCASNASFAQFVAAGKISSVDVNAGTMRITVKSVSREGPARPKEFKVSDKAAFVSLKPGDSVTFTSKKVGGVLTIEKISKQ